MVKPHVPAPCVRTRVCTTARQHGEMCFPVAFRSAGTPAPHTVNMGTCLGADGHLRASLETPVITATMHGTCNQVPTRTHRENSTYA